MCAYVYLILIGLTLFLEILQSNNEKQLLVNMPLKVNYYFLLLISYYAIRFHIQRSDRERERDCVLCIV